MLAHHAATTWRTHVDAVLDDGQVVSLRPLRAQETAPLLAVFDGMSDLSRARRYLTGIPQLPPRMLRSLTDVGTRSHVAWVATIDGQPAGLARYVAVDACLVEVAFEVVDRHHGRGLGGVLLDVVTTVACANGFRSVTATVHPANRASLRLLGKLGLRLRPSDGLLEGEGPLRLPDPPRVDRTAVLAVHERERPSPVLNQPPGLNQPCGLAPCSAQ